MRVLVVLPTYNEAENIERILRSICAVLPLANVLVVDDSSPDGTAKLALRCAEDLPQIEVLARPEKNGLGNAYKAGFRWGLDEGYEAFIEMDADFSHDPAQLVDLLAPLEDGADVVIGSRYVPGGSIPEWSLLRKLLSRFGNRYANLLLGLRIKDSTSGFRVYTAPVLDRIDFSAVRADSYCFQIEMTYLSRLAGAELREVPIRFVDRKEGISKMSSSTVTEALFLVTTWGIRRLFGVRNVNQLIERDSSLS